MELPRLELIWKKHRDKGLAIVAVQSNEEREKASKIIEEGGLTFPILQNEKENDVLNDVFGVQGFPTSYVVDREGRIMHFHLGYTAGDEKTLEEEMTALLDGRG